LVLWEALAAKLVVLDLLVYCEEHPSPALRAREGVKLASLFAAGLLVGFL